MFDQTPDITSQYLRYWPWFPDLIAEIAIRSREQLSSQKMRCDLVPVVIAEFAICPYRRNCDVTGTIVELY